jgi:hypothetical protein
MPFATTFAGDSARAEGLFNIISLGQSYWAATLTDTYSSPYDIGNAITTDSSGNVYVCGNGVSNSSGSPNAFVSKYDSSGTILWQRVLDTGNASAQSYANAITVDSSGNVYVCGYAFGVSGSSNSAIVFKYDSSGTILWQRVLGTTSVWAYGITIDNSGNVYVCGRGSSSLNLIYKLNSSGTIQWQKTLDDGQSPKIKILYFFGIVIDNSGNLYVCGNNYNSTPAPVITVAKYNSSGTLLWQNSLTDNASTPNDLGRGIAIDSSANVYVVGTGSNSSNQPVGSISKWNSSGTLQWQRTITDPNSGPSDFLYGISIDSSNNLFVTGQGLNASGQSAIFISKWNSSGTIQFQRTITDTYSAPADSGHGIIVDSLGNMYVTGFIVNTASNTVMFIAKLPSDGSRTGTYSNSTFGIVYASSSWTAATSTWTAATTSYTDATSTLTNATSTFTNPSSTWTKSLVAL